MDKKTIENKKQKFAHNFGSEKIISGYNLPETQILKEADFFTKESDKDIIKYILNFSDEYVKIVFATVREIVDNFKGEIHLFLKDCKIFIIDDYAILEDDAVELYSLCFFNGKMFTASLLTNMDAKYNFIVEKDWPFKNEIEPIESPENEYQKILNSLI